LSGYFHINDVVVPVHESRVLYLYDEAPQHYIMVFSNSEFFVAVLRQSRFVHKKKPQTHKSLDLLLCCALIDTIYGI